MTYSATVLTDTPLGFWRLGEPSGTSCSDSSGNSATGDYTNTPTLAVTGLLVGDADTAVTFARASSQYVVVYSPAVIQGGTGGLAMEAWGKLASRTAATPYVVARWYQSPQDCRLDYYENGASSCWRYFFYDGATVQEVDSATSVGSIGATVHVVVSHDFAAETVTFYINGSILGSAIDVSAYGTATRVGAGNATIARGGSDYWDGTLDEVALYGTTLSSTRVAAHYAAAGGPVWTTPADTVSMSTTPALKFTSPTSAAKQHFYMQLDTVNTFNSGNLRTLDSSTDQTNWTYWDGVAWQALPSDGLPIAKSGNEVCYTVTSALSSATWYRRVRAGVLA
jgi:hypothetical protein